MNNKHTILFYLRFFLAGLICVMALNANGLPASANVPGGIAIIKLDAPIESQPQAAYQKHPVSVVLHNNAWHAVVGLNLSTNAGEHFIVSQGQRYPFTVSAKDYPEQHIQLKTRKHIDLSAEDLARHKGEKKQANG